MKSVKGSWPALVTPYKEAGSINLEEFRRHIDFHVESESDGLLVLGSTSESTLLTTDEKRSLVSTAVDHANGRIPVMCGISAKISGEWVTKYEVQNTVYSSNLVTLNQVRKQSISTTRKWQIQSIFH